MDTDTDQSTGSPWNDNADLDDLLEGTFLNNQCTTIEDGKCFFYGDHDVDALTDEIVVEIGTVSDQAACSIDTTYGADGVNGKYYWITNASSFIEYGL